MKDGDATITTPPQPVYRKDYRPPAFVIDTVELHFDLDAQRTVVTSRLSIRRNPAAAPNAHLHLDGEGLELIDISLDGQALAPADWQKNDDSLDVYGHDHMLPDSFELLTRVAICPQANTQLEGLYASSGMLVTQCEAEGFRRITWYLDRPDVMASFRVTLEADAKKYPVLLSNGNLIEHRQLENGRHVVVWEDPFRKPCYLFALVAGDLQYISDTHTTPSGREISLQLYAEAHNIDRCDHAMASLKAAMRWDEQVYGLEYDLDLYQIVAVDAFNMGAMENKGLNVFNSKFVLASTQTATDTDYEAIRDVIGHEYFHNWTGNRVTCRDWFQLSLKEGLTVFREQQFGDDHGSAAIRRIDQVQLMRNRQFPEDAGPTAHPVRPESYIEMNNFYTLTVYEKGSEIIRMLYRLLGHETFTAAVKRYLRQHDGEAATIEDFVHAMEQEGGIDLSQFRLWYSQAGTPVIKVEEQHTENGYQLILEQHTPATPDQNEPKRPVHIPVEIALWNRAGESVHGPVLKEMRQSREVFEFEGLETESPETDSPEYNDLETDSLAPSLLRGFSAPVKLDFDLDSERLMTLVAHETDAFARWDAVQTLYIRALESAMDGADPAQCGSQMVTVFEAILENPPEDMALWAELWCLPGENYLAQRQDAFDPDHVLPVRDEGKRQIANSLYASFMTIYEHTDTQGAYAFSPDEVARRRLHSRCLDWLLSTDQPELLSWAIELAVRQYHSADNMTDQIAALNAINDVDCEAREQLMSHFYERWRHDAGVLDKWFALQGRCALPGAVERVEKLMRHADFDIKTPNRVRALLGPFIQDNTRGFHSADGAGYALLARFILKFDAINPQTAARLVTSLARWQRIEPHRAGLMQDNLQMILKQGEKTGLSRDVYEIVSKSV